MAAVSFTSVTKAYPDGTVAVHDMNLDIEDGEFIVLVGPSGCGKTTALRMMAGLENITGGEIRIGDRVINHVPPRDRDIGMVFQNYALYPHLSVYDNIAFGLKLRKTPKQEIDKRVREAAATLGLEEYLQRKPKALSGGQRQRVAMGRAIVRQPQAFLMDEPLSNLDAKLRVQMRAEISRLQTDLGVTTIYVTHDQTEAMTMGDRVAVMRKGELQQVDTPQALYDHPVNLFVAGFIGSPTMNMLQARLERRNGRLMATAGNQTIALDEHVLERRPALAGYAGREVALGVRPENLEDLALAPDTPSEHRLRGTVALVEALGSEVVVHFSAPPVVTEDTRELAKDVGADHRMPPTRDGHESRLVGRFAPETRVRRRGQIEVAVDTRNLHFFDLETGLGIYDGAGTVPRDETRAAPEAASQ